MQSENYKKRTGDVRRSARANLLEIRKARLARKLALSQSQSAMQAQVMTDHVDPLDMTNAASSAGMDVLLDAKVPDRTVDFGRSDDDEFDTLDEMAVRNAALSEIADQLPPGPGTANDIEDCTAVPEPEQSEDDGQDALDETGAESEGNTSQLSSVESLIPAGNDADKTVNKDATTSQESPTQEWSESDLAQLPGAGPGLVWMLGQCDVTTLAQLAQTDASELSVRLGVVGQILDVSQWIRFAQDRMAD